MPPKWTAENIPPLKDKVALVTGANRGLGLEIVTGLAGAGAHVIMACRDPAKADAALASVRQRVPHAHLESMAIDLADLESVRQFAGAFCARFPRLDILVNNASVILVPKCMTRDGFELHFGVNHLGAFALTGLLMDRLASADGARIVNTSSTAHRLVKDIDLDDPHFERTPYKPMEAYGKSKLAALLFTLELDRRLKKAGTRPRAVAAHPGFSESNPGQGGFWLRMSTRFLAQSGAMGALPALYGATAPDVDGGAYFGPGGVAEMRGYPAKADRAATALNAETAARLWALSIKLTGVSYLES